MVLGQLRIRFRPGRVPLGKILGEPYGPAWGHQWPRLEKSWYTVPSVMGLVGLTRTRGRSQAGPGGPKNLKIFRGIFQNFLRKFWNFQKNPEGFFWARGLRHTVGDKNRPKLADFCFFRLKAKKGRIIGLPRAIFQFF